MINVGKAIKFKYAFLAGIVSSRGNAYFKIPSSHIYIPTSVGRILNLPQDVTSFVNNLPRIPTTLDVTVVRKHGAAESHRDFRVQRSVVFRALQWLVLYNKYYDDVTIDHDTLKQLPIDSDLTNLFTMTVSSDELEIPLEHEGDPSNFHMHGTFIPAREQQAIHQSVMDQQPVDWPATERNPINEFNTEGYCLHIFPKGLANFLAQMMTITNYCKHLMLYHDQRFSLL